MNSIGQVAKQLGVSAHTLRYYEKMKLLAPVAKDMGGRRVFSSRDVKRIQFIKRAQRMQFSLEEIRALIELDKAGAVEKPKAQRLVQEKLDAIEESLKELNRLKVDLAQMLTACLSSIEGEDCPIIEGIKEPKQSD